jgi:hypothetical protein
MTSIVVYGLLVLTGILVSAGVSHLVIGLRRPDGGTNIVFAALCVLLAGYVFADVAMYLASTVPGYTVALKCHILCAYSANVAFVWFVAFYTGVRPRSFLYSATVAYAMFVVVNFVSAGSLYYAEITRLTSTVLPWGETVTEAEGLPSLWQSVANVAWLAVLAYAVYATVVQFRRGERGQASLLAAGLAAIVAVALYVAAGRVGQSLPRRGDELWAVQRGAQGCGDKTGVGRERATLRHPG